MEKIYKTEDFHSVFPMDTHLLWHPFMLQASPKAGGTEIQAVVCYRVWAGNLEKLLQIFS